MEPTNPKMDEVFNTHTPVERCLGVLESSAPTSIKREAMSSIGRRRDPSLKPLLIKYSSDINPDIVLQAIRGLLVFRQDEDVANHLSKFRDHPNDMIRDVVAVELHGSRRAKERFHAESPDSMKNVVVHGHVLDVLEAAPSRSVHLTFTSPPYYNAREYSKYRSYNDYLAFLESVFREVHRVTKEGRFFVLNTSPVIVPRAGRKYSSRRYPVPYDIHPRLTEMGWEFIDDIVWAKPEKSAKNRVAGFETNRKPLTYKTNARTEMVMVYRRKSYELIDWNLRQYAPDIVEQSKVLGDFERSNVWNIAPTSDSVHSAVFPRTLCDQIVNLYSFVGDLVFDPFAGSGTVGISASAHQRRFFMTELQAEYVRLMRSKLNRLDSLDGPATRFLTADEFTSQMRL